MFISVKIHFVTSNINLRILTIKTLVTLFITPVGTQVLSIAALPVSKKSRSQSAFQSIFFGNLTGTGRAGCMFKLNCIFITSLSFRIVY